VERLGSTASHRLTVAQKPLGWTVYFFGECQSQSVSGMRADAAADDNVPCIASTAWQTGPNSTMHWGETSQAMVDVASTSKLQREVVSLFERLVGGKTSTRLWWRGGGWMLDSFQARAYVRLLYLCHTQLAPSPAPTTDFVCHDRMHYPHYSTGVFMALGWYTEAGACHCLSS